MCEALPPTLQGLHSLWLHGLRHYCMWCFVDSLVRCCIDSWLHCFIASWLHCSLCTDFSVLLLALAAFFEALCPLGCHLAPSGSLSGGILPPRGSDLAPLGSQGGFMGTPRGHYVGHLAPQVVALGYPRRQMGAQGCHEGHMRTRHVAWRGKTVKLMTVVRF